MLFRPAAPLDLAAGSTGGTRSWEQVQALKARAGESGYVEKSNKDEIFRYHIAK